MKSYTLTTAIVFGLLTIAHLWRIIWEDPRLARDPFFVTITALAAAFCLWGIAAYRGR